MIGSTAVKNTSTFDRMCNFFNKIVLKLESCSLCSPPSCPLQNCNMQMECWNFELASDSTKSTINEMKG